MQEPGDITQMLRRAGGGDTSAEDELVRAVYPELRRLARRSLRGEDMNHSLQATALIHEAYLRLANVRMVTWQDRAHFFALSATMMRRILVDHARKARAEKRGGVLTLVSFHEDVHGNNNRSPDLIALDEALDRLNKLDERQARIVELRFFAGLSEEEIGSALGVSARTVKRDWRIAKAWLYAEIAR